MFDDEQHAVLALCRLRFCRGILCRLCLCLCRLCRLICLNLLIPMLSSRPMPLERVRVALIASIKASSKRCGLCRCRLRRHWVSEHRLRRCDCRCRICRCRRCRRCCLRARWSWWCKRPHPLLNFRVFVEAGFQLVPQPSCIWTGRCRCSLCAQLPKLLPLESFSPSCHWVSRS